MQMQTTTVGNHYAKPYPILVIGFSGQGEALEFVVCTKFRKNRAGEVLLDDEWNFNPLDIILTDEIVMEVEKVGCHLPDRARDRYSNNQKGLNISVAGIVRRYKQEGVEVTTETSECPSFKKWWDPEAKECIACKQHFPDEYHACKKVCAAKRQNGAVPEEVQPRQENTSEPEQPVSAQAHSSFKGFRQGSRADILIQFLAQKGKVTFQEAALHVATTCNVSQQKALENVKGYVGEWKKGKWNCKDADFPFTIKVSENVIIYQED